MNNYSAILKTVFATCLLFFIWIIYQANTGQNRAVFNLIEQFKYGDKYSHFVFYGSLSLMLNLILQFKQFNLRFIRLYIGSALVLVFSLLEEFSQKFIPYRTFDLGDLAANFSGVLTFAFITYLIAKQVKRK